MSAHPMPFSIGRRDRSFPAKSGRFFELAAERTPIVERSKIHLWAIQMLAAAARARLLIGFMNGARKLSRLCGLTAKKVQYSEEKKMNCPFNNQSSALFEGMMSSRKGAVSGRLSLISMDLLRMVRAVQYNRLGMG